MPTLSQSSHPAIATPLSQTNSLPDPEPFEQRPPLVQTYSNGYEYSSTFYAAPIPTTSCSPQWSYPYHIPAEQSAPAISAIPAWASDTARFYQPATPLSIPATGQMATAPLGTVQPSAIFGCNDFTDASCPQTSLGTPATSARGTPVDDEPYLRMQQATRAGMPAEAWHLRPPRTDPVPTVKVLQAQQQTVDMSAEANDGSLSEPDDSPLPTPVILQPALPKGPNGEKKKRTRTPQACEACRKRKAKCTGGQPCGRCTFKNLSCVFADIRPKIPSSTKSHHSAVTSKATLASPHQPKRRRHSDNVRYPEEAVVQSGSSSPPELDPAYPAIEDKNLLQLRFDEPTYSPQIWANYGQATYGYTGTIDTSGFSALGFQQSYVPPVTGTNYLQSQYAYQSASLEATNMAALGTPSISISTNSSPSYGEASLLSPYDFNMYSQNPVDNYFPTSET